MDANTIQAKLTGCLESRATYTLVDLRPASSGDPGRIWQCLVKEVMAEIDFARCCPLPNSLALLKEAHAQLGSLIDRFQAIGTNSDIQ